MGESREVTQDPHAKGDASARNGTSSIARSRVLSGRASLARIGELAHGLCDTLFHGFFKIFDWDQLAKIRQHRRKERRNVGNVIKFDSDLLKTKEDIALQSSRMYKRLCSGGSGGLDEGIRARLCQGCAFLSSRSFEMG